MGAVRNGFSFLKSPVNNEENMSYNMLSNISVVLVLGLGAALIAALLV